MLQERNLVPEIGREHVVPLAAILCLQVLLVVVCTDMELQAFESRSLSTENYVGVARCHLPTQIYLNMPY